MLDLHFFLISHTLASSRIAGPSTSLPPLPTTQFLLSVMGMRHIHGKESRFLRVNFLTEEFVTTFQKKKQKNQPTRLVYFPLSSSQLYVSHQSNRRQLISFLWHAMMDLCYNPDLFWELQFLKLKVWMSHAWKGYWSDVDGQLKRNWYIPYSNFFLTTT